MSNKKVLTKIQKYAIQSALEKAEEARKKVQSLLKDIAEEHGVNMADPKERWMLTQDGNFLVRQGGSKPQTVKEVIPKGTKKNEKTKISKK